MRCILKKRTKNLLILYILGESHTQNDGRIKYSHGRIKDSFRIGQNSENTVKE